MNKCKGCQWYNKPYWSIINPCENCPREETNVEIITRWIDPTIEEKDKEIERLKAIINNLRVELKSLYIGEWGDTEKEAEEKIKYLELGEDNE